MPSTTENERFVYPGSPLPTFDVIDYNKLLPDILAQIRSYYTFVGRRDYGTAHHYSIWSNDAEYSSIDIGGFNVVLGGDGAAVKLIANTAADNRQEFNNNMYGAARLQTIIDRRLELYIGSEMQGMRLFVPPEFESLYPVSTTRVAKDRLPGSRNGTFILDRKHMRLYNTTHKHSAAFHMISIHGELEPQYKVSVARDNAWRERFAQHLFDAVAPAIAEAELMRSIGEPGWGSRGGSWLINNLSDIVKADDPFSVTPVSLGVKDMFETGVTVHSAAKALQQLANDAAAGAQIMYYPYLNVEFV